MTKIDQIKDDILQATKALESANKRLDDYNIEVWPSKGDRYWYISDIGLICITTNHGKGSDKYIISRGNCYRTKEEATAALNLDNLNIEIRQALVAANDGWEADYEDEDQKKWVIEYYNHKHNICEIDYFTTIELCPYTSKTADILLNLFNKYTHESVARAFGVIK